MGDDQVVNQQVTAAARNRLQRKNGVLERLQNEDDAWVSTVDSDSNPYMVPLSFLWHDQSLFMTTRSSNPTIVNAKVNSRAVIALDGTRDVVLIDATVDVLDSHAVPGPIGDALAAKIGWDTRSLPSYAFLRFRPLVIRAWSDTSEIADPYLMRDGTWLQ